MSGEIEVGKCDICKKENEHLSRRYYRFPIKCSCCNGENDDHFEIVYHCQNCKPKPPSEIRPTIPSNKIIIEANTRRSGRTTRQADEIIQLLFNGDTIAISDHHNSRIANDNLVAIVAQRLYNEHKISNKDISIVEKNKIIIINLKKSK